jgi:hypothetical protein
LGHFFLHLSVTVRAGVHGDCILFAYIFVARVFLGLQSVLRIVCVAVCFLFITLKSCVFGGWVDGTGVAVAARAKKKKRY